MDGPIRVLHVDDGPDFAELTRTVLQEQYDEFVVESAATAEDGLERLDAGEYDCIVSDYDMPGMDGVELLAAIRERYPDIPFVLFTGKGDEAVASEAISTGATDYLQKGAGTEQYDILANRIRNAVEQHRSTATLQETREEYAAVVENVQSGLLLVGVEDDGERFRYRRCNPRALELTGLDEGDIVGHTPRAAFGPENGAKVAAAYRECLETGESVDYTVTLDLPVGEVIRECEVSPVSTDGDVDQLVVTFRDVTDQHEREAELQRTAARLEALFEHSPDMINIHDAEGTIIEPNSRLCEETGYSEAELRGTPVWEVDRSVEPSAARAFWQGLEPGDRRRFEGVFERKDGSTFPVEIHIQCLDIAGEDRFVAVSRDITERTAQATELRERNERLRDVAEERRDAETRYRSLFENTPVVMWEHDASAAKAYVDSLVADVDDLDAYLDANPEEVHEIMDRMEVVGVNERAVDYYNADSKAQVIEQFDDLVTEEGYEANREFWVQAADGATDFRTEITTRTFTGEQKYEVFEVQIPDAYTDDFSRMYTAATDITERRARERELERQNRRLEEFTSVVSHDLRSPLRVAQTRLELAQADGDSAHLDDVAEALDRSQALIDDLLALAREGDDVSERESVALGATVESCWQTVETAEATLLLEDDRTLRADPSRLRQLFENLIRNAIEHGGRDVDITVGALETGFYVADDGDGISAADPEAVFESGYSTSEAGTGFGLSIVKEIAEAHGGDVRATESADGGARFEVVGITPTDE